MSNPTIISPTSSDSTWPEPIPLSERVNLPDFPLAVCPQWFANFAEQLALTTGNTVDGPAAMALAAVSASIVGKVEVQLSRDWSEPCGLYVFVSMNSGWGKSPIFRETVAPLRQHESRLVELSEELIAEEQTERDVREMALRKAKAEAASAGGADQRLNEIVATCQRRFNAARVRSVPQMIATDATPQGLIRTLVDQGERIAILTDEGEVVDVFRAGKGLDIYLKAYDGGSYRKNLAGKPSVILNRPAAAIGAMVQPTLLNGLVTNRELIARGLLARCVFVQPGRPPGPRKRDQLEIPEGVLRAYHKNMRQLLELRSDDDNNGRPVPSKLVFEEGAIRVLVRYRTQIDEQIALGDLGPMQPFAEKQAGRVARLAGLLHVARSGLIGPVPDTEVEGAIKLADYFMAHTHAAYVAHELDPVAHLANRIRRWIVSKEIRSLSRTTCNVALRHKDSQELDAAIELLVQSNCIRPSEIQAESHGPGRQPSPSYDVNPRLFKGLRNSIAPGKVWMRRKRCR